jgi:hypothetical protein
MVPYLGCETVREMVPAFVDGELAIEEQVAVESHLRWCRTCAAHVEDLQLIGDSIRFGGVNGHSLDDGRELASLQAAVLSRVRAEHEQSFTFQLRSLFDDLHLLWAGLGATTAVVVCLFGTMSVLHAASEERPDSLKGVLQSLANPGSDRNPMLLDGRMVQVPRALDDLPALVAGEDEAVFALAAVVTREGRVANYEVLVSERDNRPGAVDVTSLLDRVARSRFAPAERGVARAPVAVNMVWLLARTTVRGTHRALDFEVPSSPLPMPARLAPTVKPTSSSGIDEQAFSSADRRPSTV